MGAALRPGTSSWPGHPRSGAVPRTARLVRRARKGRSPAAGARRKSLTAGRSGAHSRRGKSRRQRKTVTPGRASSARRIHAAGGHDGGPAPLSWGASGEVDAAAEAEFAVDAGEVGLDGLNADVQGGGDLRIALPGGHQVSDTPLGRRQRAVRAGGQPGPLRRGQGLPSLGAEAVEDGGGFLESGGGVAALAGLALRGAQQQEAAAKLERQPALAGFWDDGGDSGHGGGRVALGQPEGGFGAAAGDPRPGMLQPRRGVLQPGEPGRGAVQLAGRRPRLDQVRGEREGSGFADTAVLEHVSNRIEPAQCRRGVLGRQLGQAQQRPAVSGV